MGLSTMAAVGTRSQLALPYTAGSGTMTLLTGTGAAWLSSTSGSPGYLVLADAQGDVTVFSCTAEAADVLTGVTAVEGRDQYFAAATSVKLALLPAAGSGSVTTSVVTLADLIITESQVTNLTTNLATLASEIAGAGSGTVDSGTANQVAYYNTSGTAVEGVALSTLMDTVMGGTQGDVLYRGSAAWVVLAPGTSGQVLESGGAAANPAWATIVAPAGTLSGTTLNSTVVTSSLAAVGVISTGTWQGTAVATAYLGATQKQFTAIIGNGAVITAGTNVTGVYSICPFPGTFSRWDIAIPAANQPSGASLVIDVMKSSNQGSTWTSLWASNPGNRPTVTTGTNSGGSATAFDTTTWAAGDWLRYDVITAGGGAVQNVALVISGHMSQ